ncbi:MAG: SPOR domain-containing protein [Treponema sp.]|jgi:hypothetical protein|nr:SPOR domain-containing protein [Treponema sp.]
MKRILLLLMGIFLLTSSAMAQISGFSQRGRATQELNAEGLAIAHYRLPLNSKVMLANTSTGKEVEVTVIGRIPLTTNRIADLSRAVWLELGLNANTEILIYSNPPPRPRPVTSETLIAVEPVNEPARTEDTQSQPLNLTINTYVNTFDEKDQGANANPVTNEPRIADTAPSASGSDMLPWLLTMMMDARESREIREFREAREIRNAREARELTPPRAVQPNPVPSPAVPSPVYEIPSEPFPHYPIPSEPVSIPHYPIPPEPVSIPHLPMRQDIQILPGLPDPLSGRIHSLQVGAFSTPEAAARTAQMLGAAGFQAVYETSGLLYRVLAVNVPAAMIVPAIQRLGALGIRQIWVRD